MLAYNILHKGIVIDQVYFDAAYTAAAVKKKVLQSGLYPVNIIVKKA